MECFKCGEELYTDCVGQERCKSCDEPCPYHDGGGPCDSEDHSCDQCEALMIQSVYCHEIGCPNAGKVKIDGEWVSPEDEYDPE
jgi:hypothetical protein